MDNFCLFFVICESQQIELNVHIINSMKRGINFDKSSKIITA